MEENKIVEEPVENNVQPEVVETPQVEDVKVEAVAQERVPNAMNQNIVRLTKNMFVFSVFILCIMAIRLISGLSSIANVGELLGSGNSQLEMIGKIDIVEVVFMALNLAMAIVSFLMTNNWKNNVLKENYTMKQYNNLKIVNIIMSILFTVFTVFEVVAVVLVIKAINELGIEFNMMTSVMSIVWTALYATMAWLVYVYQTKINKELKY